MKLHVYAIGHRMPRWILEGWHEYAKRMPRDCLLQLHELRPEPRLSGKSVEQLMAAEAKRLEAVLPNQAWRVILDEQGEDLDTVHLSRYLRQWLDGGSDVAFVIGGADGLHARIKASARQTIRLSSLTLPHPLVRLLLAEQLYRAWTLLTGHPYHRG